MPKASKKLNKRRKTMVADFKIDQANGLGSAPPAVSLARPVNNGGVKPPDPIPDPTKTETGYNLALYAMLVLDKVGISRCNNELHKIADRQDIEMTIQALEQRIQN